MTGNPHIFLQNLTGLLDVFMRKYDKVVKGDLTALK